MEVSVGAARERRMVHMSSDLFGGGVDKSVYSATVQKVGS